MEPFFVLWYYGGMTRAEFYSMPINEQRWLIRRMKDEITRAHETGNDIPTKSAHHNDGQTRALTGKTKQFQTNSKTSRFT